ncbi:hypothetical protein KJ885_03615 [Patescibacteria group bacterium]|nr:hypothetical protein [Patescibacteria group bacterium]
MAKEKNDIKILLLQFRPAPKTRVQELQCFNKCSGLRPEQITARHFLDAGFGLNGIKNYDAIILGGTGDFSVREFQKKYPEAYEKLKKIAEYTRANNVPVLTVCMQFWAILFGGEVATDASRQEVGTYKIFLTKEAKGDPLFYDMPDEFLGQLGHKDHVSKLPKGAVCLAYSERCPVEAYRLDNTYFCQTHPELDTASMMERLNTYQNYVADDEYERVISSLRETPENNSLLKKWIERTVLK